MNATYATEETLNANIQNFQINTWNVRILYHDITMSSHEADALVAQATKWANAFNQDHKNWFRNEFGVPSSVIRFDYVLNQNGDPCIFEIEERPAGLEVMALLSSSIFEPFIGSLSDYSRYSGKPIGVCVSEGRVSNTDDYAWIQRVKGLADFKVVLGDLPENPETHLWFVRSLRDESKYYSLSPLALSTIEFEGDKSYGAKMGLWNEIKGVDDVDWNKSFATKPDLGCRCENIHLFKPGKITPGFSSKTKITNAILAGGVKYIQDYFDTETHNFLPPGYNLIRRCYAVYSLEERKYKIIGGLWEARPNCTKIHGASDAVCGPLVI